MENTECAPVLFCSKSEWNPPIRREHAWARIAAERGHDVVFVERPRDLRALRTGSARTYIGGLWRGESGIADGPGIRVRTRSTLVPGHRSPAAARLNEVFLRSVLSASSSDETSIVCSWPWDWGAVRRTAARRRIFDMADDWGEIMPGRSRWFASYYRQIADEADEIVIVNPDLKRHFPGRSPVLVRNGVLESMLAPVTIAAEAKRMVYVGTLTYRFDAVLVADVMASLPDWHLDLVGGCLYPGLGSEPAPELKRLLDQYGRRVRWHGQLERSAILPLLDGAAVAIVPNRPEHALGQDSMKFYDYAARGREIVSTRWFDPTQIDHPPRVHIAETAEAFAEAIQAAAATTTSADQRRWASANTWEQRWPDWSDAVFGTR